MSTLDSKTALDSTEEDPVEPSRDTQAGASSPPEASAAEATDDPILLSKDVIFDLLRNQRRRRALSYLREHETSTISDLAEHVAAQENNKDIRNLTSTERKRVYVGLYQCHLPRMSDAGVINFNQARGTIAVRESTDQLFPFLDLDPRCGTNGTGWKRPRQWLRSLLSLLPQ